MRVAVFSDVHGNLSALRAVLNHIDQQPKMDRIVFAGDLCLVGPRPRSCLELIAQSEIAAIVGNTDASILTPPPVTDNMEGKLRRQWSHIRALCEWTLDQLDEEAVDWLYNLRDSFEVRMQPAAEIRDELLIVHANPIDLNGLIYPSQERQIELYGQVRQTDDDLEPLLQGVQNRTIAYGHLHVPGVRHWRGVTLVNVSSVSLAGDGDRRAKYAVFTWDETVGWSAEHLFVPYSAQEEIEAYREARPPGWQNYVEKLEALGYFPQVV